MLESWSFTKWMEELGLLTPEYVAENILKISVNTIYAWTSKNNRKSLPKNIYIKLGRQIRFKRDALARWIEEGAELV
jgi:excisionase family DNA binding protein